MPRRPADAEAAADGAGEPTLRRDARGDAEAAGDAEADGPGEALGSAEPDGDADGVATGAACNPIGSVLISMNPVPVRIATASRPFSANTSSTCSGVTAGSANLISQRVPPVKSIVSCNPASENGRDEDEDEPGDRQEGREGVEPAAFADDVKHRHAGGGAMGGQTSRRRTRRRAGRTATPCEPIPGGRRRA